MTSIEIVWGRIKQLAPRYAGTGKHFGEYEAQVIVRTLLHEERVTPWPPDDVIRFYAREFLEMVDRDRMAAS